MSHGGSSEASAEPNLTPLLDMVLQLVMFFMLVCNFTMEQVNEDVKLPLASQAKPADKAEADVLYLNVNGKGQLMAREAEGERLLTTGPEIHTFLTRAYREREATAKAKGLTDPNTVVIIRAHGDADFAPVFNILREAKQAGFKKWQLRATILRKE